MCFESMTNFSPFWHYHIISCHHYLTKQFAHIYICQCTKCSILTNIVFVEMIPNLFPNQFQEMLPNLFPNQFPEAREEVVI